MPEGASSVTLYFTEFETEAESDFLKIYDLQTSQLLATYSGTYPSGIPEPVTSPSGKMFLTFNTNYTETAPGWQAYYESNLVNITETYENTDILLFPNPTDGLLTIRIKNYSGSIRNISLADLSGRNVFIKDLAYSGENQMTIDLRQLSPGVYILSSKTGTGSVEYHKIIIR